MADIVVTVVLEVVKCLAAPVGRRLSYLLKYKTNFDNLKAEVEKLADARRTVQHRVDEAKRKGEEIELSVDKWLSNMNKIIDDVGKILEDKDKVMQPCFMGLCPDLKIRYQLSKKAVEEEKAVVGFREEAGKFERVSYHTVPELPWLTSNKNYESFESRMSTLKDILITLRDPDVSIIGVYGMGGVGKTELVKEVARQAKKEKLFDVILFAKVLQIPDIKKIQGEIADELGLELREETESGRARRLHAQLKKEKKILVILDDIWRSLDLESIGIPYGDDHKGCKVLLTSRSEDVLSREMNSQNNFVVGVLNDTEAWGLFEKKAGDIIENREFKTVAIEVAKECAGLPIAIVTVAGALSNKRLFEWKNALRELKRPSWRNFTGMQAKVYSNIELSYNYLEDEELKSTFLLSSLIGYGRDVSIMDLFKYGIGLGIFQEINTMEEARDRVYTLVQRLKTACLLLEGSSSGWFSMHDVIRDVAMAIASRDHHVLAVRTEHISWKWPEKDTLKNCTKISLIDIHISEPPRELQCPKLKFLYMTPKDSSFQIPDNFFSGMRELRVLDLTGMQLLSLPSSIQLLVNLQTLCLDQNILADIAIIGKLKNLEILSFLHSRIEKLPEELAQLTKLKLLDLTNCCDLKVIAPNVLSSLSGLEELYMGNTSTKWEIEGLNIERSNASLDELKHLSNLTSFELYIEDAKIILPKGLLNRKLERYKIFIGEGWDWFAKCQSSRTLKLKLNSNICMEDLQGVNNVEDLCLDELQGVKSVLHELDEGGFSELKHLRVQNNPHFLSIVDSMELAAFDAFPILESLSLYNLINLEKICGSQLTTQSFCKLRTLKVRKCHKLRNIFSFSTAGCLPQLQTIDVIECKNIKEIFGTGREDDVDKIVLDQLRSLTLKSLPQFTSLFCEVKTSTLQNGGNELTDDHFSNEIISEDYLDPPTSLFNHKVVFPKLEALTLSTINFESIWPNQFPAMSSCVENLTCLIVKNCDKLKYMFSYSMVRNLVQLQQLEISNCAVLEEIVAKEGGEAAACRFVFSQLNFLKLHNLPELKAFYPGTHNSEWPALKKLKVYDCDKVKILASELISFEETDNMPAQQPLFFIEKVFPNLEELRLSSKDITMILQTPFPEHLFCKIKVLEIRNDESAALPLDLFERFLSLETLELTFSSYKELFSNGGLVEKHVGKLAQIKDLKLRELTDLKHLWGQNSKLDMVFQNLEILGVYNCHNLKNLMPSSASFRYLTELIVGGCKELINMVTSSTAKSLAQLVMMTVMDCNKMTEVVASEGDAANNEIIFSKLQLLFLCGLESLTSFCSGNYTFKFPSLIYLLVKECTKMKIFSGGILSAPRLKEVKQDFEQDEGCWEGDLNTTIQQLHHKMNVPSSKEDSGQSSMHCPE